MTHENCKNGLCDGCLKSLHTSLETLAVASEQAMTDAQNGSDLYTIANIVIELEMTLEAESAEILLENPASIRAMTSLVLLRFGARAALERILEIHAQSTAAEKTPANKMADAIANQVRQGGTTHN